MVRATLLKKGQKTQSNTVIHPGSQSCIAEETFGLLEQPVPTDENWTR